MVYVALVAFSQSLLTNFAWFSKAGVSVVQFQSACELIIRRSDTYSLTLASYSIPQFTEFTKSKSIVIVWIAASAMVDIIITIALVWHLVRESRHIFTEDVNLPCLRDVSDNIRRASLLRMTLSTESFEVSLHDPAVSNCFTHIATPQ